jgi:hypothetical protein
MLFARPRSVRAAFPNQATESNFTFSRPVQRPRCFPSVRVDLHVPRWTLPMCPCSRPAAPAPTGGRPQTGSRIAEEKY